MSPALKVVIIGAGMAGLACATRLKTIGHRVDLFDKGRGPGGRMSTRRVEVLGFEIGFDHGAQYFTVRDASFRAEVEAWQGAGVVSSWPPAGPDAWVGTPGMNGPIAHMASQLPVQFSRQIERLERQKDTWLLRGAEFEHGGYDIVVVAVPAEQVSPLIGSHKPDFARQAHQTPSAPCWTVMAAFGAPLAGVPDILRSNAAIVWAARNSSKPKRSAVEHWIIQAGPDWTRSHLGLSELQIISELFAEFEHLTGQTLPEPIYQKAHSWLYARSGANGQGHLWDEDLGLGVCGDWLLGPRVECAWISGHALANRIETLSKA